MEVAKGAGSGFDVLKVMAHHRIVQGGLERIFEIAWIGMANVEVLPAARRIANRERQLTEFAHVRLPKLISRPEEEVHLPVHPVAVPSPQVVPREVAVGVAHQQDAAFFEQQLDRFSRMGSAKGEISRRDDEVRRLADDVLQHRLARGKIAMNVCQNRYSHRQKAILPVRGHFVSPSRLGWASVDLRRLSSYIRWDSRWLSWSSKWQKSAKKVSSSTKTSAWSC